MVKPKIKRKKKHLLNGRIKSGIHNLDPLIQGGFKERSISLVVGGAGAGKTIFGMQYLLEGLKRGEAGLYITFEEKKEKLYKDMLTFNWDFASFEEKKQFFILEYSPEQVKSLIEEGGGTIDQLISKEGIKRVVIDSVTSFLLLYQDELARKEAGLALFELMNKLGCTTILTSQATYKDGEPQGISLEFEADSIILLYHYKKRGIRERAIEILKMRGTKHTNRTMELEFTEKGLLIKPTRIVKIF